MFFASWVCVCVCFECANIEYAYKYRTCARVLNYWVERDNYLYNARYRNHIFKPPILSSDEEKSNQISLIGLKRRKKNTFTHSETHERLENMLAMAISNWKFVFFIRRYFRWFGGTLKGMHVFYSHSLLPWSSQRKNIVYVERETCYCFFI